MSHWPNIITAVWSFRLKAALPLVKRLATLSRRISKLGPCSRCPDLVMHTHEICVDRAWPPNLKFRFMFVEHCCVRYEKYVQILPPVWVCGDTLVGKRYEDVHVYSNEAPLAVALGYGVGSLYRCTSTEWFTDPLWEESVSNGWYTEQAFEQTVRLSVPWPSCDVTVMIICAEGLDSKVFSSSHTLEVNQTIEGR